MNTVMRWGRLAGVAGMMGCSVIPFPRLDGADAGAADAAVADTDGGTPDAGTQDAGPPVRTVRRGLTLFGKTPTNNLLMDPLVTGTFISSLSFTGLVESGGGYDGTFVVRTDSATPADTPAALGVAFQSSDRVIIAAPFPGGQGPFRAEVWAALSDSDDEGVEFAAADVVAEVSTGFPDQGDSRTWEMVVVEADTMELGGLRWFHYTARIQENLPLTAAFVVSSQQRGAYLFINGPVVVPEPAEGLPTPQPRVRAAVVPRAASVGTRAVLAELHKRKPTLDVPPAKVEQRIRERLKKTGGIPTGR